jgi:hypothetical protein
MSAKRPIRVAVFAAIACFAVGFGLTVGGRPFAGAWFNLGASAGGIWLTRRMHPALDASFWAVALLLGVTALRSLMVLVGFLPQ